MIIPSMVILALYSLEKKGFFNVQNLEISFENSLAQPQYLQPLAFSLNQKLEALRGVSLWRLDLPAVLDSLRQFSWLESARISRRWPSGLFVTVRVKEVMFLLQTRRGEWRPVVGDGSLLDSVPLKQSPDVPFLSGEIFEQNSAKRLQALRLLQDLPSEGSFSRRTISELHFDEKEGFWMTLVKNGIKVKLGNMQVPQKSARVAQVIDYLDSHKLDARVIDANLSKKVLVRLRKDP